MRENLSWRKALLERAKTSERRPFGAAQVRWSVRVVADGWPMNVETTLLSPQQVAEYLGIPVATLYQWRYRREGPPGFRVGRHVRYRRSDVDAWIERQLEDSNPARVG